jgi:hypothetical protein
VIWVQQSREEIKERRIRKMTEKVDSRTERGCVIDMEK